MQVNSVTQTIDQTANSATVRIESQPQQRTGRMRSAGAFVQKGLTLVELMVAVAIIIVLYLIVSTAVTFWKGFQGSGEGKYVNAALTCAITKVSAPNFAATTIATLTNLTCFGEGSNVVGRGTAAATTNSTLTNTPYVVASVNVGAGVNNGISIRTDGLGNAACVGMVNEMKNLAAQIDVTPTGGALVNVKPFNGVVNDDTLGTACNPAAGTASVTAIAVR